VLEIVAAVAHRSWLDRLRPLPALRLRVDGVDWPRAPLLAAPRFRADLGLPEWTVRGRVGDRRLRVRGDPTAGLLGLGRLSRPRRRHCHLRQLRGGRRRGRPRAPGRRQVVDRAPMVATGNRARRDRHPPVAVATPPTRRRAHEQPRSEQSEAGRPRPRPAGLSTGTSASSTSHLHAQRRWLRGQGTLEPSGCRTGVHPVRAAAVAVGR